MDAIATTDLTKRYDTTVAVEGLNLSIPKGSVYAFLGPNGAGKTTTIRMLTTLTIPTSGTATITGIPITDRAAVTKRIGLLPGDPPVYAELAGREHLHYVARLHELPREAAAEKIEHYLSAFDLADAADKRIGDYSTGMKKKLGLIAAILHEPDVLFLDEPTSGLDPRAARTVCDLIADLARQDRTIFLSTHILSIADELADTIGVIHDGRLVAEGTPSDLKAKFREQSGTTLETVFLEVTRDEQDDGESILTTEVETNE